MVLSLDLEERPQDEQQAIGLLQDEVTVSSMVRRDDALGLAEYTILPYQDSSRSVKYLRLYDS